MLYNILSLTIKGFVGRASFKSALDAFSVQLTKPLRLLDVPKSFSTELNYLLISSGPSHYLAISRVYLVLSRVIFCFPLLSLRRCESSAVNLVLWVPYQIVRPHSVFTFASLHLSLRCQIADCLPCGFVNTLIVVIYPFFFHLCILRIT